MRDAWNLIDEEEEGEKILVCQYGIPITVRSFSTIHDQPLKGSNAGWLNDEVWHPWSMDFVTFTIMTIKKILFSNFTWPFWIHSVPNSANPIVLTWFQRFRQHTQSILLCPNAYCQPHRQATVQMETCKESVSAGFLNKSEHSFGKCNMAQEKYYSKMNYWIRLLHDFKPIPEAVICKMALHDIYDSHDSHPHSITVKYYCHRHYRRLYDYHC